MVLREFLLAVERPKQPLDAAIQSFAQALTASADDDDALATKFLELQPHADALLHTWPDTHGAGSRWERRESIAVFFRALSRLLRVQTQRNAAAAEVLALKVIREKNASLEKVLSWSDKPIIEFEALELMTALVGVNGAVAREFVRLFNFQSAPFGKLATRRMKKADPPAVSTTDGDNDAIETTATTAAKPAFQIREAYVRLVLALTACPDKSVHRFAMKEGGVTASLFKSIDGDSVEMLSHLFERLKELVLHNASVDNKTKLVIFNAHCVHQVLPLLQSGDDSIATMALDVLHALFFEPKSALYVVPQTHALRLFLSKATATVSSANDSDEPSHTSEQAYAVKVIRNAIVTIGANEFIRSTHAQTLVASFITAYPGLAAEYLQALSIQLEPKPGYRWFCMASLVQKLLSCPLDAITNGFPKESGVDVPSWCSSSALATRLILPLNCRKELSRGIQHANNLIIYSSLGVMEVAMRRYQFLVSLAKSGAVMAISLTELENELRFLLPSPEALVSLLLKLCSSVDQVALIYVRALVVFRLYLECLPQAMSEVKLDFTKILAWGYLEASNIQAPASKSALASLIVSEILRFLLTVDATRLHVLLPSGTANTTSTSNASRSKLLQLLLLYVQTPNQAIEKLCGQVLQRTLLVSTVFGNDTAAGGVGRSREETAIWLDSLRSGGDKCAAFMEQLVQSVLADPFKYLETFRTRSGSNNGLLSLSPGTIALVTFFNQRSGDEKSALAALRSDAQVVVFGTRVLLSLLSSAEAPQQLVALIASVDVDSKVEPAEAGSDDDEAAKKRKRVDAKAVGNGARDAYERLVQYCGTLAGSSNVHSSKAIEPMSKKLKESSASGHSKWRDAKTTADFVHQLLTLSPSAFVGSWEQIVDNCVRVSSGSFDSAFHYLDSWVGGNLVDIFQAPADKKSKKKDTNVSSTGARFKSELPLHIVLQSVLFTSSASESSRDALVTLTALLKQRISSGSLTITEAVRLCEQLLFALNLRSTKSKAAGDSEEQLCSLLLHVLSFVIVSAKGVESAPLVSFQIARILRKLNKAANETSSSSALRRKLSALEISGLRLFYSDGASSLTDASFSSLLERCGIPSVVLLSSLLPADLRICLLHKFLDASDSISSVQGVLLQHLLKSLDDDNTATYASFADYKKSKLLAHKLWTLLENTSSSSNSVRDSSFYSSSFSVLGKLGGVQADVAHKAIGSTLVPIIVSAASSTQIDRVSLTEMLRRIMLAIRSESSVAAQRGSFSSDLESQFVKRLQEKGSKKMTTGVSYSLLSAAFDVFTRIESPELLAYAHSLVGDCFANLMLDKPQENNGEDVRLSFLRHALVENNGSMDLTPVISSVFKTLATQHPDGKILSSTQQAALLLVMRSIVYQQQTNSKTQETLIVFLVKCGLQALKSLSKSQNATQQEVEATDKFLSMVSTVVQGVLASGGLTQSALVAILKRLGPQFTRAQDFNYSTVASYLGFVRMSAVFLTLATADTGAREADSYDFGDHLSVLTDHPLFISSLEDKRQGELLARVVYWLVQTSGVYDRKLFKVLLSVYGMSLSATDRLLRILFEKFDEHAGISLSQFGFRFGASSTTILSAAEGAVEPGQSRADLVDDSVWLISGGLEQMRIRATVEHFPLDREVSTTSDLTLLAFGSNGPEEEDTVVDMDAKRRADRESAYDPAFLLPMLSHFISSSDLPDAAVVQQGLLGVAVRATSSNADCIRTYAYGIVAHVHESLTSESSEFKAGRQIHLMLESFRNSIQEPLEGVSSVITVFMNDAISILCRPVHAMYPHLNHFLLARPAIDVNDVPMFYSLFNSRAPLTYKQERSWFLHTLRRGVCEDVDVMLLVRRHVLPILMSFFSSELADEHTQVLIGQILNSCLKTEGGASYLISKAAFFEWISALLLKQQNAVVDKKMLLLLMELFANALQASEGLGDELDGPQQRALALQTVNAFAALCSSVQATRVNAALSLKLAHISELVMRFAQSACSLRTIQHVVDAVSSSVSFVDTASGSEELASNEISSFEMHDVKTNSVLSCMEAIVSEKLLQHPDLHKRNFGEWAGVLSQIADVLAAFITSGAYGVAASAAPVSNITQRQRAKISLQSLKTLLDQVPSLKQQVLAKASGTKVAYAALL